MTSRDWRCPTCRTANGSAINRCSNCLEWRPTDAELVADPLEAEIAAVALEVFGSSDPIVVRSYPGRTQEDAAELFEMEAIHAASFGYAPVAQSWAEERPGIARVLAIGTLGALAIRPKGFLTVTYQRRDTAAIGTTKTCPDCGEDVKVAARLCRYCRYEFAR